MFSTTRKTSGSHGQIHVLKADAPHPINGSARVLYFADILPLTPFTSVRQLSLRNAVTSAMRGALTGQRRFDPTCIKLRRHGRTAGDFGNPSVRHSFIASRQCGAASPNTRASFSFDIRELDGRVAGVG